MGLVDCIFEGKYLKGSVNIRKILKVCILDNKLLQCRLELLVL